MNSSRIFFYSHSFADSVSNFVRPFTVLLKPPQLLWAIVFTGVILRVAYYLHDRALWLDECFLFLNYVAKPVEELARLPGYAEQYAPLGFLMSVKIAITLFSENEYSLRLVALVSGVIALLTFSKLATKVLSFGAAVCAILLFALCDPLVNYSAELKPYSTDAAFAAALVCLAIHWDSTIPKTRDVVLFSSVGVAAVWFSLPSVFMLGGIGIVLIFSKVLSGQWHDLRKTIMVAALWVTSFVCHYILSIRPFLMQGYQRQVYVWNETFIPFPPKTLSELSGFIGPFFEVFRNPAGIRFTGLAAFVFSIGCVVMFRRNKKILFCLLTPLLLCILASGIRAYPFHGRLLLFAVPSILLLVAEGGWFAYRILAAKKRVFGTILLSLLLLYPVLEAGFRLVRPPSAEEIRPVLHYISKRYQPDDTIYLYHRAEPSFSYYYKRYGLNTTKIHVGVESPEKWSAYARDLDSVRGQERVWILFSHVVTWRGGDEERFFLTYLDEIGSRLSEFKCIGSSVYLYNLK